MKSTYLSTARDSFIMLASGIIVGSWLAGEVAALLPFGTALVLVIVAAILDVAAEIRRKHEELDEMHAEAMAESRRACEFYDVELHRAMEFDRHAEGRRG